MVMIYYVARGGSKVRVRRLNSRVFLSVQVHVHFSVFCKLKFENFPEAFSDPFYRESESVSHGTSSFQVIPGIMAYGFTISRLLTREISRFTLSSGSVHHTLTAYTGNIPVYTWEWYSSPYLDWLHRKYPGLHSGAVKFTTPRIP